MAKNDNILEELQKQYSLEEIAESYVLPQQLTAEEETVARKEFLELRMLRRKNMSEKERLYSSLLAIKYQIKRYLYGTQFDPNKTLGSYLKIYLRLTAKKQKELAEDIGIHPSRLSRIIHGKEKIGKAMAYRLESHSGDLIPALYWWKLAQKEIEFEILNDKDERLLEKRKVKAVVWEAA